MSRDFLSYFEPKEPVSNENAENDDSTNTSETEFAETDHIRNVCFVWPEGKRKFLHYGRLDSGEINPDGDKIKLTFGAEMVELTGLRLLPLFDAFMEHRPKFVYCDDERYNQLDADNPIVNKIVIT